MKALSLWEPWASLVVRGFKRIETRGRPLNHRGPLLIHAAKRFTREQHDLCLSQPFRAALSACGVLQVRPNGCGGDRITLDFRPGIIGRVDVLDCVAVPTETQISIQRPEHAVGGHWFKVPPSAGQAERAFGNYDGPGRWAVLLAAPVALAKAVPCRGFQWLWDVPADDVPRELRG